MRNRAFQNNFSRDLQVWLRGRQPKSVEEMIELAEAHPTTINRFFGNEQGVGFSKISKKKKYDHQGNQYLSG